MEMDKIVPVSSIPEDFEFLHLSQDTESLREEFPDYDSFFVNSDMTEVYGIVGEVPYLSKMAVHLRGEPSNSFNLK